ncbi:hypothetical protein CHS0354_024903 [Potamilus streckersoni]|uniref:PLAT domain-containing protein n=1 Tax=Potamilus streckersoni TaxID=2493646 RepID=A0AAE0SMA9_9BIVA|nr:hypothetical protein CHS0354_024903 [Potamilus streckersoni]
MEKVNYKLFVKTGDKLYSGTDANVFIILYGTNGKKSDTVHLDTFFHNDFEQDQLDKFTIQCENLDEIGMIEFWRDDAGIGSNWYVETVKVVNQKTDEEFIFPILRWIKAHYHYKIVHLDTSLPGDDPCKEQREQELFEKRKLPPQVRHQMIIRAECIIYILASIKICVIKGNIKVSSALGRLVSVTVSNCELRRGEMRGRRERLGTINSAIKLAIHIVSIAVSSAVIVVVVFVVAIVVIYDIFRNI